MSGTGTFRGPGQVALGRQECPSWKSRDWSSTTAAAARSSTAVLRDRRRAARERWHRPAEVLKRSGLLYPRRGAPTRLSGGEKRRLEIARCLVCDPLLILLDEPFTGIDPPTITDIRQIIQ